MQKLFSWIIYLAILISIVCCKKSSGSCGSHNGRTLYKGSSGGCYYINDNGNKTYVDESECHCWLSTTYTGNKIGNSTL